MTSTDKKAEELANKLIKPIGRMRDATCASKHAYWWKQAIELIASAFPSAPSVAESAEDARKLAVKILDNGYSASALIGPTKESLDAIGHITDNTVAELEAFARSRIKPLQSELLTWKLMYNELEECTRKVRYSDGGPLESREEILERHRHTIELLSADDAKEDAK